MVHNVLKQIQCTYTGGTVYVCTAVQEQSHHVGPTPFTCHMKWSNRILKYKLYHITLVLASASFIHKHMDIYFFYISDNKLQKTKCEFYRKTAKII